MRAMQATHRKKVQSPIWWILRGIGGQPIDGYPRTDSTFFRPGTHSINEFTASRWQMHPGYVRSTARIGTAVALPATAVAYAVAPLPTELVLSGGILAGACKCGYTGYQAFRRRQNVREYVRPLHYTIAPKLGYSRAQSGESYITLPNDFWTNSKSPLVINLPNDVSITADLKDEIEEEVERKTGAHGLDSRWVTVGKRPYVEFSVAPAPPKQVTYQDLKEIIDNAPEHRPVFGVGRGGKIIDIDLDGEYPHMGISGGTGDGKSVQTMAITVQLYRNGADILMCDTKGSHRWARDLPRVKYLLELEDIHVNLIHRAALAKKRNIDAFLTDEPIASQWDRKITVLEEMNDTITLLRKWWEVQRVAKKTPEWFYRQYPHVMDNKEIQELWDSERLAKSSPAITAMGTLVFTGRSAKCNVIIIAQSLSARASGGGEILTNIGCISMGGSLGKKHWDANAPEAKPYPRKARNKGRVFIVKAGQWEPCQVVLFTEQEAKAFALSIEPNPVDLALESLGETLASDQAKVHSAPTLSPPRTLVSLREIAESRLIGLSLDTIRRYSREDHTFPKPIEMKPVRGGQAGMYDKEEILEWDLRRQQK